MSEVFGWIKSIIFIIIMSSFIEIIMPNGSYKKYIRLVFGIIMIVIIIQPITLLLDSDDLFQKTYFETSHNIHKSNILDNNDLISEKQSQLVISTYEKKIEKEIKLKVNTILPDANSKVDVDMDTNVKSSGFGSIRKVYIELDGEKSNLIDVDEIKRIDINLSDKKEEEVKVTNFNNNKNSQKLKEELNIIFGVPKENIIVNSIQKGNKG